MSRSKLEVERKNKTPDQVAAILQRDPQQEKTVLMEVSGQFWAIVTWGEHNTGGYAVKITEVFLETTENGKNLLTVMSEYTGPQPGSFLTQVFTYPSDVVLIKGLNQKPDVVQFIKLPD